MEKAEIGLYDIVKSIRADLAQLISDEEIRRKPLFFLEELEIELHVRVTSSTGGNLRFMVLTGELRETTEKADKIKLKFKPLNKLNEDTSKKTALGGVLASPTRISKEENKPKG